VRTLFGYLCRGPRVPSYATADAVSLSTQPGRFEEPVRRWMQKVNRGCGWSVKWVGHIRTMDREADEFGGRWRNSVESDALVHVIVMSTDVPDHQLFAHSDRTCTVAATSAVAPTCPHFYKWLDMGEAP